MNNTDTPPNEGDRCLAQSDGCYLVKMPFAVHSVFIGSNGSEGFFLLFLLFISFGGVLNDNFTEQQDIILLHIILCGRSVQKRNQ